MQLDKNYLKIYVWLILLSIVGVAWLQWPRLGDPYRVDEDFRSFYWFAKFQNPHLFPNDPEAGTRYVEIAMPWGKPIVTSVYSLGYDFLFYTISFVVEPVLFSKLLPFALMPVTVLYLFEFGRLVRDRNTGLVLGIGFLLFNLAASSAVSVLNGLQRSFALTFMIALLYYLQAQKYRWALLTTLIAALFYPPACVLMLATWGMSVLLSLRLSQIGAWLQSRATAYLVVAVVLIGVVLSPAVLHRFGVFNSIVNPAQAAPEASVEPPNVDAESSGSLLTDPAYGPGGRSELFNLFPFVGRGGIVDLGTDLINLLILLVLSGLIVLVRGRVAFKLPRLVWVMLAATILMFTAAWLVVLVIDKFLLYLPSRYTRVGLFLFLFLFFGLNAIDFVKDGTELLSRNLHRLVWLVAGIGLVILGLLLFYPSESATIRGLNMKWLLGLTGLLFGVLSVAILRRPPTSTVHTKRSIQLSPLTKGVSGLVIAVCVIGWLTYASILTEASYLNPPPEERALLQFLKTLPEDSFIGGSPCILDSVELFSERSVVFSCERTRGGHIIDVGLSAYYASDRQTVTDFCQEYGIDYLVIDLSTFSDEYLEDGRVYFEPYNRALLTTVAHQERFVLTQAPDEAKLFKVGKIYVTSCNALNRIGG